MCLQVLQELAFASETRRIVRHARHIDFIFDTLALHLNAHAVSLTQFVRAVVIKALQTALPSHEVASVQVANRHIGREEHIHALPGR